MFDNELDLKAEKGQGTASKHGERFFTQVFTQGRRSRGPKAGGGGDWDGMCAVVSMREVLFNK